MYALPTLAALALSPAAVHAILLPSEFGGVSALLARQDVSGEQYACHADCGYAILEAEAEGHCDNGTWTDLVSGCLDCAVEYDIWQHYEDGVTVAAEACGLDATPGEGGDGDEEESDDGEEDATPTTSEPAGPSSTPAPPTTSGTAPPTTEPSSEPTPSGTPSPSVVPDGKANGLQAGSSLALAVGIFAVAITAMMN